MTQQRPKIGVTANFLHNDPARPLFRHKALHFVEERMATSVWRCGGAPWLIPQLHAAQATRELLDGMDGLLLSGGADVSPRSYHEKPVSEKWQGDFIRDQYEIDLLEHAIARGLPVLGICRGLQLINVAFGGTLWQDIETLRPGSLPHRDWNHYDDIGHEMIIEPNSWLAQCYPGAPRIGVNSVHHQAIRELARSLRATAHSPDGLIEAVEWATPEDGTWLAAVQWHPEWLEPERVGRPDTAASSWAVGDPILHSFIDACRVRMAKRSPVPVG